MEACAPFLLPTQLHALHQCRSNPKTPSTEISGLTGPEVLSCPLTTWHTGLRLIQPRPIEPLCDRTRLSYGSPIAGALVGVLSSSLPVSLPLPSFPPTISPFLTCLPLHPPFTCKQPEGGNGVSLALCTFSTQDSSPQLAQAPAWAVTIPALTKGPAHFSYPGRSFSPCLWQAFPIRTPGRQI